MNVVIVLIRRILYITILIPFVITALALPVLFMWIAGNNEDIKYIKDSFIQAWPV